MASTSCQTRRSSARPGLDPLRQVGDGRAGRSAARRWFWTAGRSRSPTIRRAVLGDDADDELGRVVDRDRDLLSWRSTWSPLDEEDLELLAERRAAGRRGRCVLSDGRRQVDRRRERVPPWVPPCEPELAADRRAVVLEVDLDRDPGAEPGVALEQDPRPSIVGASAADGRPAPTTPAADERRERAIRTRGEARGGADLGGARDGARGLQVRRTVAVAASTPGPPEKLRATSRATVRRRSIAADGPIVRCRSRSPLRARTGARRRRPLPRSPCPRSVRSAPSATTVRRVGDLGGGRRAAVRRASAPDRARARWPATRPTSSASTCPPRSPATSRTSATGGRPGRSRRGAPTGRSTRTRVRRSTSTSRPTACPGTDVERTQRGFFARLRLEPFGPGAGVLPHERTLAGPREDRYRLLRATGVNTSPVVGLYDDPTGPGGGDPRDGRRRAARRRRRRRRRRPPPAVGRRGGRATAAATIARRSLAVAARRADHDRRRPPPLRDRAALPRRAADDALVRGGPGVRLPPDAVPRGDAPSR